MQIRHPQSLRYGQWGMRIWHRHSNHSNTQSSTRLLTTWVIGTNHTHQKVVEEMERGIDWLHVVVAALRRLAVIRRQAEMAPTTELSTEPSP